MTCCWRCCADTRERLVLLTPYFNLPRPVRAVLGQLLRRGCTIDIMVGDKTANDFFIPPDQPFKTIGAAAVSVRKQPAALCARAPSADRQWPAQAAPVARWRQQLPSQGPVHRQRHGGADRQQPQPAGVGAGSGERTGACATPPACCTHACPGMGGAEAARHATGRLPRAGYPARLSGRWCASTSGGSTACGWTGWPIACCDGLAVRRAQAGKAQPQPAIDVGPFAGQDGVAHRIAQAAVGPAACAHATRRRGARPVARSRAANRGCGGRCGTPPPRSPAPRTRGAATGACRRC